MNINIPASQKIAVVGAVDPDVTPAGGVNTAWIEAHKFHQFLAIVMAGTLGSSATLAAKITQAQDGSGTGAKDVDGKAITTMTQAGTDQSDKQALIDLRPEDLDVNNGFTHFRLELTVATATSDIGAIVLGVDPADGKAADFDAASVDQVIA